MKRPSVIFRWTCRECPFVVSGYDRVKVMTKASRHKHYRGPLDGGLILPGQEG